MDPITVTLAVLVVVLGVVAVVSVLGARRTTSRRQQELADALADARRWTERLGGQVMSLDSKDDPAARQALADAAERYTAAGGQLDQTRTPAQAALARQTALEGLYYVRAARTALGLDPGPELPAVAGQELAGVVDAEREVELEGRKIRAAPAPSPRTTHYFHGGVVAGRPVPGGWYSEPFWRPALISGVLGGRWRRGGRRRSSRRLNGRHRTS